jgi:hypothetical protein
MLQQIANKKMYAGSVDEGIGSISPQPVWLYLLDVASESSRGVSHAYVQAVSHCSSPDSHIAFCHHGNKFTIINATILIIRKKSGSQIAFICYHKTIIVRGDI